MSILEFAGLTVVDLDNSYLNIDAPVAQLDRERHPPKVEATRSNRVGRANLILG